MAKKGIEGFATNQQRSDRLVEARQWASEAIPYGHSRSVGYIGTGERGDVPITVRIERIDLHESLSAFLYDRYPELWPGAATYPVHDETCDVQADLRSVPRLNGGFCE
jgi:hypothetical protein